MSLFPRQPRPPLGAYLDPVDQERITREALALGVVPGGVLVVHSSMRALGHVRGGPETVIAALRQAIGPAGTLVMPTFSFSIEGWGLGCFDVAQTPSRVGLLTDVFRRMAGVLRSHHPSHSVAAQGRLAEAIVAGDPAAYTPLGIGSPLDRARALGAQVLLIGVRQDRNSTIHVAEAHAEAPYLAITFTRGRDHELGLRVGLPPLPLREMPGSSEGFNVVEPLLEGAQVLRRGMIGRAACQLCPARETVEVIAAAIRRDPGLLLRGPDPSELSRRRLAGILSTGAPSPR